ncbi:MAG: MFS transporter [Paludibacteraceae bacterium]|nr:MFS transporter [Paludibacteraceae bacterium]
MIQLTPDNGIPRHILLMMATLGAFTVANLYYNQPLLDMICNDTGISQVQANMITVITQIGYAIGLLFVVPLADMVPVRRIVIPGLSMAAFSAIVIGVADNAWLLWGASLMLGLSSIMPQLFIPMATLYSRPENKTRNLGYMASGIMTGIVSARAISGYVGEWFGWRTMFFIVAGLMLAGLFVTLKMMPQVFQSFHGSYRHLMHSVADIFRNNSRIRLYALRPAMSFASMMCFWSCMAFHLAGDPFHAGSDMVGLLGLCGAAGAVAASGVGKTVQQIGTHRMSVIGGCMQILAWLTAWQLGNSFAGLVAALILADIGAQCLQISNQSACLRQLPEATNRVNTIFMTTLFIGGSLGTFLSGLGWNLAGWAGVCAVGMCFASTTLLLSAYERFNEQSRTFL